MESMDTAAENSGPSPVPVRRRIRKRKACVQCTKAKRKCDKTSPRCQRCLERGVDSCEYKPLAHVFPHGDGIDRQSEDAVDKGDGQSAHSLSDSPSPQDRGPWFLSSQSWKRQYALDPNEPLLPIAEDELPQFIIHLKDWAKAWVTDGHSPIMHQQLYRNHMPECVQDAFTAMAAYHGATTSTKCLVLHIINGRANRLLELYHVQSPQQPQPQSHQNMQHTGTPSHPQSLFHSIIPSCTSTQLWSLAAPCVIIDTATHLARTQALFIYQLIRLFDGDIRSRAQAEEQMDVLHTWTAQMFESARLDCVAAESEYSLSGEHMDSAGGTDGEDARGGHPACELNLDESAHPGVDANANSEDPGDGNGNGQCDNSSNTNLFLQALANTTSIATDPSPLWRAWILSESIRRVFLVATYMQGVYTIMKRGWDLCPGGVAFTPLAGLWDAPTAWAWLAKAKRETRTPSAVTAGAGVGAHRSTVEGELLPLLCEMDSWIDLKRGKPEDVDSFTRVVLGVCDNRRWGTS